jgi:propionate catabolism operon transcriptional regulator
MPLPPTSSHLPNHVPPLESSSPSAAIAAPPVLPRIVAVGYRRLNKLLQELAPEVTDRARVDVVDVAFEQAVARIRAMQANQVVDVVVSAGSNGGYLRQHLDLPVVLVKVGGFDVMRALASARRLSTHVALVTYDSGDERSHSDLAALSDLTDWPLVQRHYRTEEEARACVQELAALGIEVLVGPGLVADLAEAAGLQSVFLYSSEAVRQALADAVEVARTARIEQAKRDRLQTILGQLSDGVIAVDREDRVLTLNPRMAEWLGVSPEAWQGHLLAEVGPELSAQAVLRSGQPELEHIERVQGRSLIISRTPIREQGVLTGAVITCQDPVRIQRVDRHIRARSSRQGGERRYAIDHFVGHSAQAQAVREMALHCAHSDAAVLITGESGTGKELMAQGIHQASVRRDMPFVALNCGALSENLLESELFGYEDGAFTGARKGGKVGLFEAAHRGSLLLDEIGDMPLSLQTRLLRVLQEREVTRLGATEPTPVNVRVMAATHHQLPALVKAGRFRLDLYYRLNILSLSLPPLRARSEDWPDIVQTVMRRATQRLGQPLPDAPIWTQALLIAARGHDWPGNVRELENIVERILVHASAPDMRRGTASAAPCAGVTDSASGSSFSVDEALGRLALWAPELRPWGQPGPSSPSAPTGSPAQTLATAMDAFPARSSPTWRDDIAQAERHRIEQALSVCGGDRSRAAAQLGMSRTTLWRKLKAAGGA